MYIHELSQQVTDYFKTNDFPSIALLNGSWGSGKTYYVKKHLTEELNKNHPFYSSDKKCHNYISLYGIKSVDDFNDRLLSTILFKSNSTNKSSYIRDILGLIGKSCGDQGITQSVLTTLSKPLKHKLLQSIENCIIIIDDLERASTDELVSNVLGECLNLAENHNNVWILVIANKEKCNAESLPLLEKTFFQSFNLEHNLKNIIDIIKDKYNHFKILDADDYKIIEDAFNSISVKSLRVIFRIIGRYICIKNEINKNKDTFDLHPSLEIAISSITKICSAHFEHGFSHDEIINQLNHYNDNLMYYSFRNDEESAELILSDRDKLLQSILFPKDKSRIDLHNNYYISDLLIEFCIEMRASSNKLIHSINFPKISSNLEKFNSLNIKNINENEWSDIVLDAKNFILKTSEKNFRTWCYTLKNYIFYTNAHYIDDDLTVLINDIKSVIYQNDFFEKPLFINLDAKEIFEYELREDFSKIPDEFLIFIKNTFESIQRFQNKNEFDSIEQQIYLSYLSAFKDNLHKAQFQKSFISRLDIDKLILGITNSWSVEDTRVFCKDLQDLSHSFYSIEHKELEKKAIIQLRQKLEAKSNNIRPSLRKGKLMEIIDILAEY